jgi:hypothetical protein
MGGMGVPVGGFMSEPQWKMRVATAWTREPEEAGRFDTGPLSTMVIISLVFRVWTWYAVFPSGVFQVLSTLHFWPTLPGSCTVKY